MRGTLSAAQKLARFWFPFFWFGAVATPYWVRFWFSLAAPGLVATPGRTFMEDHVMPSSDLWTPICGMTLVRMAFVG